jgi:hypothetical protein
VDSRKNRMGSASWEYAGEEKFEEVFRSAVYEVLPNSTKIFWNDTLYSAARGAAEIAKRAYWIYNNTGKRY